MPGRAAKKAKAAFLGNAASLLLPHMVDELSFNLVRERTCVNGAVNGAVRQTFQARGTRAISRCSGSARKWAAGLPGPAGRGGSATSSRPRRLETVHG